MIELNPSRDALIRERMAERAAANRFEMAIAQCRRLNAQAKADRQLFEDIRAALAHLAAPELGAGIRPTVRDLDQLLSRIEVRLS